MTGYDGYVAAVARNARTAPDRIAIRFSRPDGDAFDQQAFTYRELDRAARSTAAWLQARLRPGDRVLLLHGPGLNFVTSFLGCLYAGVYPAAAPLPTGYRNQAERAAKIVRDARISQVLTDTESLADIRAWAAEHELTSERGDDLPVNDAAGATADPSGWTPVDVGPSDPAFLQYTSGSTSTPRGVVVSHGNLVHNVEGLGSMMNWSAGDGFCSWLPTYHDMGLIAMLLCPLYLGSTVDLLSAHDFLRRPLLWLKLIDMSGAAVSAAPNFAYDLCCRRVSDEQIAALDLSRWGSAANGAEPIDAGTLARFAERFAPAGFRPEALAPGYGLAETTLGIAASPRSVRPVLREVDGTSLERNEVRTAVPGRIGRTLVSSGVAGDHDIRVVDPESRDQLPDRRIGEIWVGGGSVALGYWEQPEETERTFRAMTTAGDGPFLRTGDLGFFENGELFVTGRIKELIIIHGRNLYPHDLERELRAVDPAFADRVACAFSVPVPQEEIVVVSELRPGRLGPEELAALAGRVRRGLAETLDIRIANVVFVKVGQIMRTTSGKIQRRLMSELFRTGELAAIHEDLDPATRARWRPVHTVPAQRTPESADA